MNDLQHIPEDKYGPVLATLNPPPHIQVDKSKMQGRWSYDHPVIDDKVRDCTCPNVFDALTIGYRLSEPNKKCIKYKTSVPYHSQAPT
jgi:hypothetical protein